MTHCTSTIVAFRFACSAGNATFTTVLSINAILEARVVATSTQRPAIFEHGALAKRERIMLSSQGSWIDVGMMASYFRDVRTRRHCAFPFLQLQANVEFFICVAVGSILLLNQMVKYSSRTL